VNRRALGIAITAGAIALVSVQFLGAAGERAGAMREEACRALAPDPLPPMLRGGQDAPDFELADSQGKTWSLKSLRGRPVLLNFWATWCPPCVEEMPSMEALARRLGDRAVVLAVSVDEDWETVKKFFSQGTDLPVLLDTSKEFPKKYGTEKYPETFLIDSQGKVRHAFINKRNWGAAEAALCVESVR
jgi:peroxiredoxin